MVDHAFFSDISVNHNFIASIPFFKWNKTLSDNDWFRSVRLSEYFDILSGFAFKSEDYEEDGVPLLRIGDIKKDGTIQFEDMNYLPIEFIEIYKRFLVKENDIAIAMTGATIGKSSLCVDITDDLLLNQRVGILRVKINTKEHNIKFLSYLLKHDLFIKQIYINSMGKSQPNISPFDILKLKVPSVYKLNQDAAINRILLIENEIKLLKSQYKVPLEAINEVFAQFYGFSKTLWLEFGKGMTAGTQKSNTRGLKWYNVTQTDLSRSKFLRFSTRFHNPTTKQLTEILSLKPTKKVKSILIKICKGIQPKYSDNGIIPVVKITNMKNGFIDLSASENVDEGFYNEVKSKSGVKFGDVLICCTGKVSLGKIDYFDLDEDAILSVDSYILRVNEKEYNPIFLIYFFRSILGAFQIERDYTGTTNQIHLYESQIVEFEIPEISLLQQEKIVEKIKVQLDSQKETDSKIEIKRKQIMKIIEEAIKP